MLAHQPCQRGHALAEFTGRQLADVQPLELHLDLVVVGVCVVHGHRCSRQRRVEQLLLDLRMGQQQRTQAHQQAAAVGTAAAASAGQARAVV